MTTAPDRVNRLATTRIEVGNLGIASDCDFEQLADCCAALANEGGGQIELGVADSPSQRVVEAPEFEVPERIVAGICDRIGLTVTWDEVQHSDGRVFQFHVPSRPLGQAVGHKGRYLMRAGEQLVPMPHEEMKRIMAEEVPNWTQRSAMPTVDGQTVTRLLDTQSYFILSGSSIPTTERAVLDQFEREGLVRFDNGSWTITNLGAILFARNLEDFDLLRRKSPRVTVFEGNGKFHSTHDQFMTKGYAVGFDELVNLVTGLIPHVETFELAQRRRVKKFPAIAVRELITNALIHQDFEMRGMSVDINIFDDRMEISSPGTPSIEPERFIDMCRPRNDRLADLMRQLGICEVDGTGVDKVVSAIEESRLPPPDFRVGVNRTTALLFSHKEFGEMDSLDRLRAAYQHCCLRYVQNERMTDQSLRDRFGLPRRAAAKVSRVIKATMKQEKVKLGDPSQAYPGKQCYAPFWA